MDETQTVQGYDFLRKGRKPYAVATLSGCGTQTVSGEVFFYDTPMGILLSARVEGLPSFDGVYEFCLEDHESNACRGSREACLCFPLIYTKKGKGSASLVSEALRRIPLCGRRIFLRESRPHPLGQGVTIAIGMILGG